MRSRFTARSSDLIARRVVRLTPSQVGMTLLLGGFVARLSTGDLKADLQQGRDWLKRITKQDFGHDVMRWHDYLWESDAGGYKWCRRSKERWAREILRAMNQPEW